MKPLVLVLNIFQFLVMEAIFKLKLSLAIVIAHILSFEVAAGIRKFSRSLQLRRDMLQQKLFLFKDFQ